MLMQRRAGVLLHISSLPSGDMGEDAFLFVDFLNEIGATVWQTLPLNMPHGDGSPYQSLSSHAGNPAFISLKKLELLGLLSASDLSSTRDRELLLTKAFDFFELEAKASLLKKYNQFCKKQAHWLDNFALFCVLRHHFGCVSWGDWPDAYKNRDAVTLSKAEEHFSTAIKRIKFIQFIFFEQWAELRAYANKNKVYLFGDIPIFVAFDSADVWAEPNLFKLDADKNMTVVAGVPPDYFSETGQRWGNPHYNWSVMKKDKFKWWLSRMATQHAMFDILRIDHFRGLEAAWEIPADEDTAINGAWVLAPGDALLKAIVQHLPDIHLVAEDLGVITPEVDAIREKYDLPGMKILQFAFDGGGDNPYLPEFIGENSVAYTGTHDNDTTLGWYQALGEGVRQRLHQYLNNDNPNMPFALIEVAFATQARLAIVPMQDILDLDSVHRMNVPGTSEGNWTWHFDWKQLKAEKRAQMAEAIQRYDRKPSV